MLRGCIQSLYCEWRGKAHCMSLRGTELKRCAQSGADEESASPERNMWMPGRQQDTVQCLCALVCRHASNSVQCKCSLYVHISRQCATQLEVELALVIRFTYSAFSNGLPRNSIYCMNENLLQLAHSSLEPLVMTLS